MRRRSRPVPAELIELPFDLRRYERVSVTGSARLMIDTPCGTDIVIGDVLDLSEGGAALRIYRPLGVDIPAHLVLDFPGAAINVPVLTKWCHDDDSAWTLGLEFDQLAGLKRSRIRRLLASRSRSA